MDTTAWFAGTDEGFTTFEDDERCRLILKHTHTVIFEYNLENGVNFVSPAARELLEGRFDERDIFAVLLGDQVVHPADRERLEQICTALSRGTDVRAIVRLRSIGGGYRWYRLSTVRLPGETPRALGTIADVDEEMHAGRHVQYRSNFDPVTDIYNREAFYRHTKRLLDAHPNTPHCIVRFDIGNFKIVNDLFGVVEGDRLLHSIGQSLRRRARTGETYARLGDDVFSMCVARSEQETAQLIRGLGEELSHYPLSFRIVLYAGICKIDAYDGCPVNLLSDHANLAQRTVKGSYATSCAFYEQRLGDELFREQEIVRETGRAMHEGQFAVYLQPKVEIETGRVIGSEALVRWLHPDKGCIPPAGFIPLFEKNGFIIELDEYVWEQTCRILRGWLDRGLSPLPVSVNVSRLHLYDPGFCDTIVRLVRDYQLPTNLIELELTESAYTENPQTLYRAMETLQGQGFAFLMDDFGSGYSSLNMLKDVSVDVLKLDMNFLRETWRGHSGRIILEETIVMARRLGLSLIAEGVETREQADFLLAIGCNQAQGFLYSKPLPVGEFERFAYPGS